MNTQNELVSKLWAIGFSTILELETAEGILASGKNELFGCVFGRDCLITSLKLLKVFKTQHDNYFLSVVKKVLLNLGKLQGQVVNIESGEQPGKCIHEYRVDNHDHLTKNSAHPGYVNEDGTMRNYDTVNATSLFLIAVYEYYKITKDEEFLKIMLPKVKLSLSWVLEYSDSNGDGFVDYEFSTQRKFGGLKTQSWMDSFDSIFHEDGTEVAYPIAPVEVQSYTFLALKSWAEFFKISEKDFSTILQNKAINLKENFNRKFVFETEKGLEIAFAIDGNGKALVAPRSSIGHCLWGVWEVEENSKQSIKESILEEKYIPLLAERLLKDDLFEASAGIRTLSNQSKFFKPNSYHNGSIWPHDTAMIIEGLENFGFQEKADQVRKALLSSYEFFQTPIELFVYEDGKYSDYHGEGGQTACKKQAWSAAALLSIL
jgi:glycogen debranching enzyme